MSTACDTGAVDKGYELWTNTAPILGPPPGRGSTSSCCRLAVSRLPAVPWSPSSRRQGFGRSLPRRSPSSASPFPSTPVPASRLLIMKLAAVGVRFVAVNLMIDGKYSGERARGREQGGEAGAARERARRRLLRDLGRIRSPMGARSFQDLRWSPCRRWARRSGRLTPAQQPDEASERPGQQRRSRSRRSSAPPPHPEAGYIRATAPPC